MAGHVSGQDKCPSSTEIAKQAPGFTKKNKFAIFQFFIVVLLRFCNIGEFDLIRGKCIYCSCYLHLKISILLLP